MRRSSSPVALCARARRRGHHGSGQLRIVPAADDDDGSSQRRGQLGIARPPLGAPDRPRSERHEPGLDPASREPGIGRGTIRGCEPQRHLRRRQGVGSGQREQPLDLVALPRSRNAEAVGERRRGAGEPCALGNVGQQRQGRAPPGAVGEYRAPIAGPPKRRAQPPETPEPGVGAALVVADHPAHGRMPFEQRRRGRRGDYVHRTVAPSQRGEQRGREHDVTQERRLNDERPACTPRRPCAPASVRPHSTCSTARNASCGISTAPICFIRFLPSFCFSRSLRFRVTSPP